MKSKSTVLLVAGVVAMGLLTGTSAAQETEVILEGNDETGGDNATGIRNLTVASDLYDVIFVYAPAVVVYPGDPPDWDFSTEDSATQAVDAVADALNTEPSVTAVGPPGTGEGGNFAIGYETVTYPDFGDATYVTTRSSGRGPLSGWSQNEDGSETPPTDAQIYAKFLPPGTLDPLPGGEPDGLWYAPSKPGWSYVFIEGLVAGESYLGLVILRPNFTVWDMFYGPVTVQGTAILEPYLTTSDMRAQWTQSGNNGTLTVLSCTTNCPLNAGEDVPFVKAFGDNVDPLGN